MISEFRIYTADNSLLEHLQLLSKVKMKLAIVALVVFVALGSALPAHKVPATRGLKEDFSKFIALLPKDQIRGIAMDYLANDAEVQEVAEYVSSDDFKTLIVDVESIAEYKKVR